MTENNCKPSHEGYCCDGRSEQVPIERKCIGLLISANREHKCMVENYVEQTGLHRSQHHLLMILSKYANVPSQKEIAERLGISPAAVAVTLKKLEKNGYIERCAAVSDNRYNEIRLSEKGKSVVEYTKNTFYSMDKAVFADFSEDDLRQFSEFMEKIRQNIRNCESAVANMGKDESIAKE